MFNYEELTDALINGKAPVVRELTEKALAAGERPQDILNKGLVAGMGVVGEKFKNNEFYVPEVLIAARAMKFGMEILRPKLAETGVQPVAKVAIGTVRGDLHDIGKNLVGMMMEGAGFEIVDLGVDVKPEQFVQTIKAGDAGLVCLSALLTTTMPAMKETIQAFQEAGLRSGVSIMIGGAPVTQSYADEIGADGYAPDAASAVDRAKELLRVA
ncbi:MAG TPA: corrinoid protein [Armatimonadota bacterium]|nr:corrinoid protein [Armatimonadota bacterium]